VTGVADQTRTIDDLQTGGTVRPIVRWGTPVMHNPTRPTTASALCCHSNGTSPARFSVSKNAPLRTTSPPRSGRSNTAA